MLIASFPITHEIIIDDIPADGIEFRLDFLAPFDIDFINKLRNQIKLPIIFTLRKPSQGGFCTDEDVERQKKIIQLCELHPDYVDLEYDTPHDFVDDIKRRFPTIKLICSYHNFHSTPHDVDAILQQIYYKNYDFYKIATFATSTSDALRMLIFAKSTPANITGICMGEHGKITRLLSPSVGNTFSYASVTNNTTAPGQIPLDELLHLYHYPHLNQQTEIFALLGNPVDKSVGHILHNQALRILNKNAIYVKLMVQPHELADILTYCRRLPFKGFSITMPLKELITSWLDENTAAYPAVNTIAVRDHRLYGFNTDGIGALMALKKHLNLQNKTIVILGAGGASHAIAHAAITAGANIIIFNRTLTKAQTLAADYHGQAYSIDQLDQLNTIDYAAIINTIPQNVLNQDHFKPGTIAMDIVYQPIHTPFLKLAKQAGCICIPGYEMYIEQALLQIQHWFAPTNAQRNQIHQMMEMHFLSCIKN